MLVGERTPTRIEIDIVHFDPVIGYFEDYHHTLNDNMEIIDRRTPKAVGQTLLHVLYNE